MQVVLPGDATLALRLSVAALAGLAVGIEREWSHERDERVAQFAGLRTFALCGFAGGLAGVFLDGGAVMAGAALLFGGAALAVVAYAVSLRGIGTKRDPGATTEMAAIVVLGLGLLAGLGHLAVAGGAAVLVALTLGEKARLHWLVRHIGDRELRAGLQFLVLALVVLPLLPTGPFGPWGAIRPRELWGIVLVFSGIDFAGYVARRVVGLSRGYGLTGLIGGLVSSTAVTLGFSRRSRGEPASAGALAIGVIGACTVLLPRVIIVSGALSAAAARALVPYVVPPLLVGIALAVLVMRRQPPAHADDRLDAASSNPLRLWPAIQMAAAFQLAILLIPFVQSWFGSAGILASAAVLGFNDVDALAVSMSRLAETPAMVAIAARAIAVGILSNTLVKLGIVLLLGSGRFRKLAGAGLGALALASGVGFWLGMRAW